MIAGLSNRERLMRLYDPNYVRRVDAADAAPVSVCLESRSLQDNAGTGVATYARGLAACLAEAGASPLVLDDGFGNGGTPRPRMLRWLSATQAAARTALVGPGSGEWVVHDLFREAQVFFNLHGRLLPVAFARPPEVMHWTYPVPLRAVGARNLYTIHDLIPLTAPDLTRVSQARHAGILREIVRHAHGLVTVSETVREQVVMHLGVPADRVVNTYQTVDAPLQADPGLPNGLRSGGYFFFCGRVEPRKNLERLAAAHAASGTALPLVIVGPELQGEHRLEAALRARPGIVRLPWVPRDVLLGMMRRARALLFPSLAEGFGLPIAEAMTLGCPVLTSDRGAAAEIAGEAAWLIDPRDTSAIASAIAVLDRDDMLCARLRASGFARGRMFTRSVYARRLRSLYSDALAAVPHVKEPA